MNKTDTKHVFALIAVSLIILTAAVIPASADTSVAWTKEIGDVSAAKQVIEEGKKYDQISG